MSRSASGPSQRQLRVGEQVRAALSALFQRGDIDDSVVASTLVNVSEVRMSPDLKIATAYVTPLGGGDHAALVAALNRHARFIRGRLAPALRQMKFMPEIRFRDDTSFETFRHIDALLRSPEVARDLDRAQEADSDGPTPRSGGLATHRKKD